MEAWAQGDGQPAGPPDTWRVHPGVLGHHDVSVEPDLSNAVPFLAAALVTGGTMTISDWPVVTSQPADQILALLASFGATFGRGGGALTITGPGRIAGVTADLADAPGRPRWPPRWPRS